MPCCCCRRCKLRFVMVPLGCRASRHMASASAEAPWKGNVLFLACLYIGGMPCIGPLSPVPLLGRTSCCVTQHMWSAISAMVLLSGLPVALEVTLLAGQRSIGMHHWSAGANEDDGIPQVELQRSLTPTQWDTTVAQPPGYRRNAALVRPPAAEPLASAAAAAHDRWCCATHATLWRPPADARSVQMFFIVAIGCVGCRVADIFEVHNLLLIDPLHPSPLSPG
jgi:hypothetical protein